MSNTTEFVLGSTEAAARLGVTDETVRRWADAGKLRHVRLPSGQRRYRQEDLDLLLTVIETGAVDERTL